MIIKKSFLINLIFIFCFFPFLNLVPFLRAETQPIAALFALLFLFMFGIKKDRTTHVILSFLFFLVVSGVISIALGIDAKHVTLLTLAYMLPLFIFLALKDNVELLSVRVFYFSLAVYFCVGVLQHFGLLVWAEPFMQVFISRIQGHQIGGSRGVTFLATEPGSAGQIILLFMVSGFFFYMKDKISRQGLFVVMLAVVTMFVINKSGTAFLLLSVFFMILLIMTFFSGKVVRRLKILFSTAFLICVLAASADFLLNRYSESVRFVTLLDRLIDFIKLGNLFSFNSISWLGGKRFLTVLLGYISLSDNYGLGHGIASYLGEFQRLSYLAGIEWTSYTHLGQTQMHAEAFKSDSYASQIAMDVGILGLMFLVILMFSIWKGRPADTGTTTTNLSKSTRFAMYGVALFMVFFRSTTTLPVPWVILAFIYSLSLKGNNARGTLGGVSHQ